ncbi:MAG: hypothetical protein WCP85_17305 [Mariniphaga sp.]
MKSLIFSFLIFNVFILSAQVNPNYFTIRVVDQETMRAVPMVEFKTTNQLRYYTDSNGIIAFNEPRLMGQWVSFALFSHGYECPAAQLTFNVIPGKGIEIRIRRINIAERLYRITGQDIYGESAKVGLPVPIQHQGLNGKVFGQDTFIETLYKDKLYWFWGDTMGPASFNGHAAGATSGLPGKGGLDPNVGIDLEYFTDSNGLNKGMCDIQGPGLIWIDWLATLPDEDGIERLYAKYTRTQTLDKAYERGIALYDDFSKGFKSQVRIDKWLDRVHSSGHPVRISSGGLEYLYIFDRYGLERVRADAKQIIDPDKYERYTCLAPGSKYTDTNPVVEPDPNNQIIYGWKTNADALSIDQQNKLISSGKLPANEGWFRPIDVVTGKNVPLNPCSVFWNNYRKSWVMIAYEFCGGIWFLEADTPTGPWTYARMIVSHDKYDFYNPGQHPIFDQEGGRIIYFEGTYTMGFSGTKEGTPLYDYNQMMYRLTLDDERLSLPAPVYFVENKENRSKFLMYNEIDSLKSWINIKSIPFYALPASNPTEETIPVYLVTTFQGTALTTFASSGIKSKPQFYALPLVPKPLKPKDPVSGTWKCTAIMKDSVKVDFELLLFKDGNNISGPNVTDAHYEDDTLTFTAQIQDYMLTGKLVNKQVYGTFRNGDNSEKGKWNGTRPVVKQETTSNPLVTYLYEYKDNTKKSIFYSVDPELSDKSLIRTQQPICRVWKNPSSVISLDYMAKPVRIEK